MNILRTFKSQKWRKYKNKEPQTSLLVLQKKVVVFLLLMRKQILLWIVAIIILEIIWPLLFILIRNPSL